MPAFAVRRVKADDQPLSVRLWAGIDDIYEAILAHPFIAGLTDGSLERPPTHTVVTRFRQLASRHRDESSPAVAGVPEQQAGVPGGWFGGVASIYSRSAERQAHRRGRWSERMGHPRAHHLDWDREAGAAQRQLFGTEATERIGRCAGWVPARPRAGVDP